ncbi:MAG: Gfo/Idh/MocA family oxidoreductase [Armatimonadia bacterium]
MPKTKIAIIGAGAMANKVHYPSLASFEDVEIAAICDLDETKLNETADKYGVSGRYADYRKMVEEVAPAAVWAIGQPQYMYDVWVWCLQQGVNLYIEKPMGLTLHQSRMLATLAEEKQVLTQVSFQRRTCPMVCLLRDKCLERGPIVHAVCQFYKSAIAPMWDARDHMMDDGVHALDTVRWMCGGEAVRVQSVTKAVQVPDINFISALIEFDNGATGMMVNSWTSGRRTFRVEMHAPNICAEAEHETVGRLYADEDTVGQFFDTKEVAGSEEFHVYGGFAAKNREFVDCLKTGTLPGSHFGDAIKTMELANLILAQAMVQ